MKEWLIRGAVAIAVLVVVVIAITWIGAGELLDSANRDFGVAPIHPPASSEITFASASGTLIHGWVSAGHQGQGVIILLHGLRGDRRDMVARANFLKARGHAVILFDFQAHGETRGKQITFGKLESRDVVAAIQYVQHKAPNEKIGVLGVSLGAAAFVLADGRPPVAAVVLEQMYPTIERAVENRVRFHVGPLAPLFAPLMMTELQSRLQIPQDRLRPIERMGRIGAPVLIIDGTEDNYTPVADARALFEAASEPKELWTVDGAAHVNLYTFAKDAYEKRVGDFFERYLVIGPN
jgi:alpha-beta hydrolase superfamily lysophospholipase